MEIGISHAGDSVTPSESNYGLDVGGVTGMVATAASATVSGVVGIIGSGIGLSMQYSAMKLQLECFDQLDKADSPPIPKAYIYLLAVQSIFSLCEGFVSFTDPLYTSIMFQCPWAAGEPVIHAPAALDLSTLLQDNPATQHVILVLENGWPALLAALSFIISTNLSDELFIDVLSSYQASTNVAEMLALSTPRNPLFNSLSKFAIPSRVVSNLVFDVAPLTPWISTSFTNNLAQAVLSPCNNYVYESVQTDLLSQTTYSRGHSSFWWSWFGLDGAAERFSTVVLTLKTTQSLTPRQQTQILAVFQGTQRMRRLLRSVTHR